MSARLRLAEMLDEIAEADDEEERQFLIRQAQQLVEAVAEEESDLAALTH